MLFVREILPTSRTALPKPACPHTKHVTDHVLWLSLTNLERHIDCSYIAPSSWQSHNGSFAMNRRVFS